MFENNYIISHRGIYDNKEVYENTLEAFKLALYKKYAIELDVRLTKDNKVIVFHDANTKRLTCQDKVVEESTYEELNKQKKFHIPLLSEVLELVKGNVPLLIEVKEHKNVGKLEQVLMNILNDYKGKYAIQSFSPLIIYWFKRNYPKVPRGQLSKRYKNKKQSFIKKILLENMYFNIITKPNFISYKYNELSLSKINKYKRKNIKVLGWTIPNDQEFNKYKDYYDNLICDKTLD